MNGLDQILATVLLVAVSSVSGGVVATRPAPVSWEVVVPVRMGSAEAHAVLAVEGSGETSLLTCKMSAGEIRGALILIGVLPAAGVDDSGSPVEICLAPASGGRKVRLAEVINIEVTSWRFTGNAGALIVPGSATKRLSFRKDGGFAFLQGKELSLTFSVPGRRVAVIFVDRFGRLYLRGRRVEADVLVRALRDKRKPKLEAMVIHDPFALKIDIDEAVSLCRRSGMGKGRIVTVRADRGLGLDVLTIPEHRWNLQKWVITQQLTGTVRPWDQLTQDHRTVVDQFRDGLTKTLDELNELRGQISLWHEEYQNLTTRSVD